MGRCREKRDQIAHIGDGNQLFQTIWHDGFRGCGADFNLTAGKREFLARGVRVIFHAVVARLRQAQACQRTAINRLKNPRLEFGSDFATGLQDGSDDFLTRIAASDLSKVGPDSASSAIVLVANAATGRPRN